MSHSTTYSSQLPKTQENVGGSTFFGGQQFWGRKQYWVIGTYFPTQKCWGLNFWGVLKHKIK